MPDPVPRLHGREDELAALGRALERAESGRLALVTLEGEPGIGKTRLLDAGLDAARARGARVVTGRAGELDGGRPFGLWCDALRWTPSSADPARASIATLLAPRPTAPGPITVSSDVGLQYRVVDALVDLVEELAHPNPLVIGLDDLQWADPSSLVTVASLVRRLTHASVAVIGCLRPVPRGPELAQLLAALHEAGACMLELDELSEAAVLDLASDVLRVSPRGTVRAGLSSAGGNPLYVTELASALAREGAEPPSTLRAPSLRLTILRHVSVLPGPTVDVLRSAAILGSRFSVVDLSTTTGRSVHDLSAALEPAIRARVLVDDADHLRFRHDLIHDAVYTDSATSVRRGLHVEAGRRLAETGRRRSRSPNTSRAARARATPPPSTG